MVPEETWGAAAEQFQKQQGHQVILCNKCVDLGLTTPPQHIVVEDGESLCLEHREAKRHMHS